MIGHLSNVAIGAGVGIVTSLSGYFKNRSGNSFEWKKALPTVVISAAAGGVVGYAGMPLTESSIASVVASMSSVGITEWITNIVKGFTA